MMPAGSGAGLSKTTGMGSFDCGHARWAHIGSVINYFVVLFPTVTNSIICATIPRYVWLGIHVCIADV
jgi:hypothetical protein